MCRLERFNHLLEIAFTLSALTYFLEIRRLLRVRAQQYKDANAERSATVGYPLSLFFWASRLAANYYVVTTDVFTILSTVVSASALLYVAFQETIPQDCLIMIPVLALSYLGIFNNLLVMFVAIPTFDWFEWLLITLLLNDGQSDLVSNVAAIRAYLISNKDLIFAVVVIIASAVYLACPLFIHR
jgi:hypothetical protein